jgi:RND superfamily putative drug exporter
VSSAPSSTAPPGGSDPTVKMLAVGMAVAVLIDATIVRMILVPSVMTILGAKAWWIPRWLDAVLPNFELEGDGGQPEEAALPPVAPAATGP